MKLVYYISTMKLTRGIINGATEESANVLNETLRPHIEDPEQNEGDLVHADLEEAKRLARCIVFDLGDKGIDVLAVSMDDSLYDGLVASGDIRDSKHSDPYGGRLLKLSQHACREINRACTVLPIRWLVPTVPDAIPHTVQ